ncbi:MAG TPA: HAMP domain-containing sensor histidine kinase [Anaeromyxobacter sp.]|nr:HAMP domain-containing sensor histidine kinase [Anaeromyxobacter sp.]
MGPGPGERWTRSLSTRPRLVAAFGVVVVALVGVEGALFFAVHPQLSALHTIADDHARAVEEANRIRSRSLQLLRRIAPWRAGGPGALPLATSAELNELADEVTRLAKVADEPFEQRRVELAVEAVEQLRREASLAGSPSSSIDAADPQVRALALLKELRTVSTAADEIVGFDARQVEQGAHQVHQSLLEALIAAFVVSALGVLAALLLLRRALAGLAREQAHWSERSAEAEAFAARAAHELKTPLQTVTLALAQARAGGAAAVERALRGAQRLSRTIDDLLEFSRAGVAPRGAEAAGLADAAGEVLEELGAQLEAEQVEVCLELSPGLRAAMAPGLLRTVLRNLLVNALRYGITEGSRRVRLAALPIGQRVEIEVVDEGPGIAPKELPHLFEAFVRASSRPGGFGLGLATVKRVVEAHGGTVAISSQPGAGTRVRLELPAAPLPSGEPPRAGSLAPPPTDPSQGGTEARAAR